MRRLLLVPFLFPILSALPGCGDDDAAGGEDAGGDPDDEQSLVRFLLYANEWDIEGIIANRPVARAGENRNTERTGLAIVRRVVETHRGRLKIRSRPGRGTTISVWLPVRPEGD